MPIKSEKVMRMSQDWKRQIFVVRKFTIIATTTMDFRPREALFFGDNFFRFGPIGSKFLHLTFQPKRRFLSIWSVNKKTIIRVLVNAS